MYDYKHIIYTSLYVCSLISNNILNVGIMNFIQEEVFLNNIYFCRQKQIIP